MLFLDGLYVERPAGSLHFRRVKAPTSAELVGLTQTLARRIGRYLEHQGLLERDADDCRDAGGRAMQEQLPRTATWLASTSKPGRWTSC